MMAKRTLKKAYDELNDTQKRAFVTRLAVVTRKSVKTRPSTSKQHQRRTITSSTAQ